PRQRIGSAGVVPGSLLEFKAGRMFREGGTNWVHADLRRGLCYLKKGEDGLLRFCWKDIKANHEPEEELIVFPGDVALEKVPQSDDRVYVLKFKSSSQRHFFWIQEPNAEDDGDIVHSVNVLMNEDQEDDDVFGGDGTEEMDDDTDVRMLLGHPVREGELRTNSTVDRRASTSSLEAEVLSHHREQSALAQENVEDHMRDALPSTQVGGVRGNRGSDMIGNMSPTDLNNLRQLLSSIKVPQGYDSSSSDAGHNASLRLADVLTPSNLSAVLSNDRIRQSLFPTLPDNIPQTEGSLEQVIRSPQFQQALNSLSYVLESGQIAPLVAQLGLSPEA
ncbi:hypothetical protein GGI12_005334, partial [Dipsacomyces acuminosporus]